MIVAVIASEKTGALTSPLPDRVVLADGRADDERDQDIEVDPLKLLHLVYQDLNERLEVGELRAARSRPGSVTTCSCSVATTSAT